MNEIIVGILIIGWLGAGLLAWGLNYAYFSRKWPELQETRTRHILWMLGGPGSLMGCLFFLAEKNGRRRIFKYGFKL